MTFNQESLFSSALSSCLGFALPGAVHAGALLFVLLSFVQAPLKMSFSQGTSKLFLSVGIICETVQLELYYFKVVQCS